MTITATLINLYHVCKRETWLHANGITMEHTSDTVYEGKLIGETTYPQRPERYTELALSCPIGPGLTGAAKIDFYDAVNKVVHEVKKSDSVEKAHEWQVKFYLWLLQLNGIPGATGKIDYPKMRQTHTVLLSQEDVAQLTNIAAHIHTMVQSATCPPVMNSKICKSCSYYDFCYVNEL